MYYPRYRSYLLKFKYPFRPSLFILKPKITVYDTNMAMYWDWMTSFDQFSSSVSAALFEQYWIVR